MYRERDRVTARVYDNTGRRLFASRGRWRRCQTEREMRAGGVVGGLTRV